MQEVIPNENVNNNFKMKYLVLEEMAKTSEDILFRRTKLGINFPKEKLPNLENILKKYL